MCAAEGQSELNRVARDAILAVFTVKEKFVGCNTFVNLNKRRNELSRAHLHSPCNVNAAQK